MKYLYTKGIAAGLLLILACGVGCSRSSAPPAPLTAEELPAVLEKAFSTAKAEAKERATQVVAAVQAKDYSKAFWGIQTLATSPGLTKAQMNVTARATLTISGLLQAAQAAGDQNAAATLKTYRENK